MQVITWPMGFIIMAKGRARLLIFCELAWGVVSLCLAWVCVTIFGLDGAGIAFFGSYVFHVLLIYPVVHRLSGFRWSSENRHTSLLFGLLIAVVFSGFYVLPFLWASVVGILAAILSGTYSFRVFCRLVPWHEIPRPLRRLVTRLGVAPAGSATAN
jgi:PST family polysaccharide transporter